jgi:hypothetical protein
LRVAISTGKFNSWNLVGFLDARTDETVDGMGYQNYPLQYCSVQQLEIVQGNSPVAILKVIVPSFPPHANRKALVICNTTADQFIILSSGSAPNMYLGLNLKYALDFQRDLKTHTSTVLDIRSGLQLWNMAQARVMGLLAP